MIETPLVITHPDKVLFPEDGITKGELAAYYEAVADLMVPHIDGRPVTMERFPNGIGQGGFLQKDVSKGFPEWLERVEAPKKGGVVHYPLVRDSRSLLWLANQNCITPHVWTSRTRDLYRPDLCGADCVQQLGAFYDSAPRSTLVGGIRHLVVTPYQDMDHAIAVVAWGYVDEMDQMDTDRVMADFKSKVDASSAPERGAV